MASRIREGHAVSGNQTVQSAGTIWRVNAVSQSRNQELLSTNACQCEKKSIMLELSPDVFRTSLITPVPEGLAGDTCFVEYIGDNDFWMQCLSCTLPSGRIIRIDTNNGAMLNGGTGFTHLNMDNRNNHINNLAQVNEAQARHLLVTFQE
ncbi:hypothetical protein TL16_g03161 [Triparma laevis f. inornata]|uniref:Uncharacterized protein n=1 Tax=Triparma laevis f. inornata TaxID=1714386 RepID=A0A9W7A125_9STRA|nr:hypothetical protein TL16_g03161 [Triparma laevis f. inornata]